MGELLWIGENRVDRASQWMLGALVEADVLNTTELRWKTDLSQNAQVSHRLENHLIPSGLVEEIGREARPGGTKDVRRFQMTSDGREWVADHAETLAEPATIEEMREAAREARSDAASAKESVQSYRRKVHRLKRRVEDVEGEVEELEDWRSSQVMTTDMMWARYKEALREDQVYGAIDERLTEALEPVADRSDVRATNEQVAELVTTVERLEGELETMKRLEDEVETLRAELDEVREEVDRGFWDRLLSR